jgi:hypothetical protein
VSFSPPTSEERAHGTQNEARNGDHCHHFGRKGFAST